MLSIFDELVVDLAIEQTSEYVLTTPTRANKSTHLGLLDNYHIH